MLSKKHFRSVNFAIFFMGEQDDGLLLMYWFLCCYINESSFSVHYIYLSTISSGTPGVLSTRVYCLQVFGPPIFLRQKVLTTMKISVLEPVNSELV